MARLSRIPCPFGTEFPPPLSAMRGGEKAESKPPAKKHETDEQLLFSAPVHHLLAHHIPSHLSPFSPIITRDFRPPKPSPAGILHIAQSWNICPDEDSTLLPMIMVGDSVDDMAAGRDAGALTVLLRSAGKEDLERDERTDVVVSRYVISDSTRRRTLGKAGNSPWPFPRPLSRHGADEMSRLDELIDLLSQGIQSQQSSRR